MGSDDEVVGEEQIQLFRLYAGELVDLTDCLLSGANFKVGIGGLAGGRADAQDFNGLVLQVPGNLGDHLGGADDAGGSAVALALHALHPQQVAHFGVVGRAHIVHHIVEALFLCDFGKLFALQSQGVLGGVAAVVDGHPVQGVVHLLGSDLPGADIVLSHIVVDQVHGGDEGAGVVAVIQPHGGGQEPIHGHLLPLVGVLGGLHGVVGAEGSGDGVAELHAAGEDAVVLAGGHGVDCLLNGQIPGAAGLAVVDGALALHAKPVADLDVGGQVVGAVEGAGLTMEVVIHILGGNAGILHGLQGGIAEQLALGQTVGFLVVYRVHKGCTAHADDGYASAVGVKGCLVHVFVHIA